MKLLYRSIILEIVCDVVFADYLFCVNSFGFSIDCVISPYKEYNHSRSDMAWKDCFRLLLRRDIYGGSGSDPVSLSTSYQCVMVENI